MKIGEMVLSVQELFNTLRLPVIEGKDIVEILILAIICYSIIKAIKGTRAWVLMKGILALIVMYGIAYTLKFNVMIIIFQNIVLFLGVALIITVQPELRRLIEKIGSNKLRVSFKDLILSMRNKESKGNGERYSKDTVDSIVKAVKSMSGEKTGALIVIEKEIPLNEYISTGISLNADVNQSILINIFEPNTPLHDGAIIIRGDKIISGTCYLPLSDSIDISKDLGTRHRAAIGITDVTDAIVVIVSEETGAISFVDDSKICRNIGKEELTLKLNESRMRDYTEGGKENWGIHRYITNNFTLKLSSLIVTTVLWIALISSINPITEKSFSDIPVNILNEKVIKEMGMTYSLDEEQKIDVIVTDRKNVIDNIKPEELEVIADMKSLSITNSMQLETYAAKYPKAKLRLNRQYINISIEEEVSKEMNIDILLDGDTNEGNFISSMEMEDETVTVTGAKSIISKIDRAEVKVDQSKLNESTKETLDINIYDKNGDKVDQSEISLNRLNSTVAIEMLDTKIVDVVVQTKFSNKKAEKYIDNIDYSLTSIRIAGTKEKLREINTLDIEVPVDLGYEEIIKAEFIKSIDLDKKLLDKEVVVAGKENKLQITYTFKEKYVTKETIGKSNIDIMNQKDKLEYDLKVLSSDIILISNKEIVGIPKLSLDVGNLRNGIHEIKLPELKNGVEMYESINLVLTVKNKEN